MKPSAMLGLVLLIFSAQLTEILAQSPANDADAAFKAGNELMNQRKPAEALVKYKAGLALEPKDSSLLYNAGLAAFSVGDYVSASDFWKRLKALEPLDWHTRAKLIQTYQALNKIPERNAERAELFALRKSGDSEELSKAVEYCREQFAVNGQKVMAFEQFELKGDRALRYVFGILNQEENREEWRISLGSYETTNAIWHETTKPKPKPEERLFHLDGYFPSGHATYGMYFPEPTYDETRAMVVKILEGKSKPVSSTTIGPAASDPKKPKP